MKLEKPFTAVFCGSTAAGKTYLAKKIIKEKLWNEFDYVIILCPTCKVSNDWDEFKEQENPKKGKVVQKFDSDIKEITLEMIDSQRQLLTNKDIDKESVPNVLLIFDDMIGNRMLDFRGILDNFSTRNRHYKISMMFLIQRLTGLGRTIRVNCKYLFLFNCSNYSELERFICEFCPAKYKKKLQDQLEDIYNEDYNFMFIENQNRKIKNKMYKNGEELIKFEE